MQRNIDIHFKMRIHRYIENTKLLPNNEKIQILINESHETFM